jgi:hypothetical protein
MEGTTIAPFTCPAAVTQVRLVLGSNSGLTPTAAREWVVRRMLTLGAMANVSLSLRANATENTPPGVTRGLIWGSPEHDTCHSPDYYYHNQVWCAANYARWGGSLCTA